jgi:hypothetical protein
MGADGRYQSIGVTSFVASAGCQSGLPDGFVSFFKMSGLRGSKDTNSTFYFNF